MIKLISQGDVVKSVKGRDKDNLFLVVKTEGNFAYLADGCVRKITALKKKNQKHLELVKSAVLIELAEKISCNNAVANKRLKKELQRFCDNKKQEE